MGVKLQHTDSKKIDKAYSLYDKCGYECLGIYFGETVGKAKENCLEIGNYWGEIDFVDLRATREPWADKYGDPDKIPDIEYLLHGYIVKCVFCDYDIDEGTFGAVVIFGKCCVCEDCIKEHTEFKDDCVPLDKFLNDWSEKYEKSENHG